jgi:hypothetical protein
MASYVGIPANNPTKYLGPNDRIVSIVTVNRSPTGADIRQGTTGQYYPIGSFWIVAKNPTTGTEGFIWYLSKIVANVAYWVLVSGGSGSTIEIDTPDGAMVVPVNGIINFLNGTGMNITGSGNNITFNSTGGFSWVDVTAATQTLSPGTGYLADRATLITFSLPVTAAFGDTYIIAGYGAGGWTLAQHAGQSIIVGPLTSTVGVTGGIASIISSDLVEIVCVVADTTFKVVNTQGNVTVT